MTWKKLNLPHFGSTSTFGGADIDKISKVFDGTTDIDEQDINSSTTIRSGKLKFRNPADTYSYSITPSAISGADKTVTLPALANDSEFVFENAPQTLSNKTISASTIQNSTYTQLSGIAQDPREKRWGSFQPIGGGTTNATVGKTDGILKAWTGEGDGTPSVGWDSTHGLYANFRTGTALSDYAGLLTTTGNTSGIVLLRDAGRFKVKMKSSHTSYCRFGCGFTTANVPPDQTLSLFVGSNCGILLGALFTGGAFHAYYKNPTGPLGYVNFSGVGGHTNVDTNVHTFEASWPDGGTPITATLDNNKTALIQLQTTTISSILHFQVFIQSFGDFPTPPYDIRIYSAWLETST